MIGARDPVLVKQYQLAYRKYFKPLFRISSIPNFLFFFAMFGSINSEFQLSLFICCYSFNRVFDLRMYWKIFICCLTAVFSFFILINSDDEIRQQESTDFSIKLILKQLKDRVLNLIDQRLIQRGFLMQGG